MYSFSHDLLASGIKGKGQSEKDDRLLPHQVRRRNRLTVRDKNPEKNQK